MEQIGVQELVARLEAGEKLRILDVREAEAFDAWHIHGSENLPVYHELRSGDVSRLIEWARGLSEEIPIVAVCNAGVTSRIAVEALTATEIHAVNLQGGIHAWSSAWTKAQVPLCRDDVGQVVQVRRNGKGCLSYLVVSNGVAAVFDASVAADVYVGLAKECAASIKYVFETHIHADHVSRGSALAARVGAEYLLPVTQRYYGACGYVGDGETLSVGSLDVTVHSTPGHTSESVSYLISDSVLLTGDTLFLDSVGRPDLERGDAGAEEGARKLYATLHDKLLSLSDQVLVCPAHSAASIGFDGVPLVRELADIRNSISLLGFSEEVFVETILSGLGSKPNNHLHVIEVNQGQRTVVDTDLLHLEVGPNRCAAC